MLRRGIQLLAQMATEEFERVPVEPLEVGIEVGIRLFHHATSAAPDQTRSQRVVPGVELIIVESPFRSLTGPCSRTSTR